MSQDVHPMSAGRPLDIIGTPRAVRDAEGERETESKRYTTPSSLGMALEPSEATRARLASVILSIRPDWRTTDVLAAINTDDRPWRTVVMAHITAAYDPTTAHPNRARTIPFGTVPAAQPLPNVQDALNPVLDEHGFPVGRCPECRRGGRP